MDSSQSEIGWKGWNKVGKYLLGKINFCNHTEYFKVLHRNGADDEGV